MSGRAALLQAGYKPEQIVSCMAGDPCPCEYFIASLRGYSPVCGLASKSERASLSAAMRTMDGARRGD